MEREVEDRDYIQPESETIDWVVYAEYVSYKLGLNSQDGKGG